MFAAICLIDGFSFFGDIFESPSMDLPQWRCVVADNNTRCNSDGVYAHQVMLFPCDLLGGMLVLQLGDGEGHSYSIRLSNTCNDFLGHVHYML
jgi:hypothetical protein